MYHQFNQATTFLKKTLLMTLSISFFGTGVFFLNPAHANTIQLDQPVAVVNNQAITFRQLKNNLEKAQSQTENIYQLTTKPTSSDHFLEDEVRAQLDAMIEEKLIFESAKGIGLSVDDATLNQQIRQIANQNQLSMNRFYQTVENSVEGGFSVYREQIRKQILIEQLKRRLLNSQINISDEEIAQEMDSYSNQYSTQKLYKVKQIYVSHDHPDAFEQIQQAHQYLENGAEFTLVAKQFSNEEESRRGETIGWIDLDKIAFELKTMIQDLEKNEVSKPQSGELGWYVFKLIDTQESNDEELALRNVTQRLRQARLDEEFNLWVKSLRTQNFIDINEELLAQLFKRF